MIEVNNFIFLIRVVRKKRDAGKKDTHIDTSYSEQSRESKKKYDNKVRKCKIMNDGPPINSIMFLIKLLFC
jgi:hypothetical protein